MPTLIVFYAPDSHYYHPNDRSRCNPTTGRYLTSDPIGLAGGETNTYIYVNNQPWRGIDLWGLYAISQADYMKMVNVTDKALAGRMFDADMNASNYLGIHNTRAFPSTYRRQKTLPRTIKYSSVIPDNIGYMSYAKLSRNAFNVLATSCINEIYFEFKLTSEKSLSISYNDYQLSGMIDTLKKPKSLSNKKGRNGFIVVTGSNTKIGKSLINFATSYNVAIYHSIAQVDDNNNKLIYMGQPILLNPTKDKNQLASEIGIIPTRKVSIGRNGVEEND